VAHLAALDTVTFDAMGRRVRPVDRRAATIGSLLFFLAGPLLEMGAGPFLLTGGWERGDDLPVQPLASVLGALLIAAGLAVVIWCFMVFVRDGRGTPTPAAPTTRLVATGPYGHVRHPMYAATTAVIAGQGLVLARPVLFIAAAAYATTLALLLRFVEEPRLRRRFGADYDAYRARVPSCWPGRDRPGRIGS